MEYQKNLSKVIYYILHILIIIRRFLSFPPSGRHITLDCSHATPRGFCVDRKILACKVLRKISFVSSLSLSFSSLTAFRSVAAYETDIRKYCNNPRCVFLACRVADVFPRFASRCPTICWLLTIYRRACAFARDRYRN